MASSLFPMKPLASSTPSGIDLQNALKQLYDAFQRVRKHRLSIIQEKDGNSGTATDYVTAAQNYGFVATVGATDSTVAGAQTVAFAAFTEIDSFVGNSQAALEQICAKFQQ